MNVYINTIDIVRSAVEPLRADAIARAEQQVRGWVARIQADLEAAGNDIEAYAPRPHGTDWDYKRKLALRQAVERIIDHASYTTRPGQPRIVSISVENVERLVENTRQDVSASFDAYVKKLAGKVGTIRSASVCGASLWHGSTLTVETEAGTQRWRTQQILNVSGLGKVFNQWPTRRAK